MAWTPRISGDGNWATFYSDSNYGDLAAGTGDYRDYQIYAADLRTHPYSVHLVFAHATKDSKAPEMSYDGKRVVLVNDGEAARTGLYVYDAKEMEPVAIAWLNGVIPYGLHGTWADGEVFGAL